MGSCEAQRAAAAGGRRAGTRAPPAARPAGRSTHVPCHALGAGRGGEGAGVSGVATGAGQQVRQVEHARHGPAGGVERVGGRRRRGRGRWAARHAGGRGSPQHALAGLIPSAPASPNSLLAVAAGLRAGGQRVDNGLDVAVAAGGKRRGHQAAARGRCTVGRSGRPDRQRRGASGRSDPTLAGLQPQRLAAPPRCPHTRSLVQHAKDGEAGLVALALLGQGLARARHQFGHNVQLQLGAASRQQVLRSGCVVGRVGGHGPGLRDGVGRRGWCSERPAPCPGRYRRAPPAVRTEQALARSGPARRGCQLSSAALPASHRGSGTEGPPHSRAEGCGTARWVRACCSGGRGSRSGRGWIKGGTGRAVQRINGSSEVLRRRRAGRQRWGAGGGRGGARRTRTGSRWRSRTQR